MPEKYQDLLEFLKGYSYIIWDWNGTILNDAQLVCDINNVILDEHDMPRITFEQYRDRFKHPVVDYYRDLGFNFDKVSFAEIGDRFIELYSEGCHAAKVFDRIPDILKQLQLWKIGSSILSAAHQPKLRAWVKDYGLDTYFEHVIGINDHYAASKVQRGVELLKKLDFDRSEIAIVGDTDHDFEVAIELGVDIALIANGHQSAERLRKFTSRVFQ